MVDILLVHGSCHGAWCWRDLIPELEARGHSARALDLPGHGDDKTPVNDVTLDTYAKAVVDALGPQTVLVGHSMGGYVITAAAAIAPAKIAKMIYLCAYVPQDTLSLAQMRAMAPRQPLLEAVNLAADRKSFTLDPAQVKNLFYHDCSDASADFAAKRLCAQATAPSAVPCPQPAPSTAPPRHYIRCMADRTIPPEFQVTMTQDWPAHDVSEMNTSHSPFLSQPAALAAQIDAALQGTTA